MSIYSCSEIYGRVARKRKERIDELESTLRNLLDRLEHVYWPAGESPLGWSNDIDSARRVLQAKR